MMAKQERVISSREVTYLIILQLTKLLNLRVAEQITIIMEMGKPIFPFTDPAKADGMRVIQMVVQR